VIFLEEGDTAELTREAVHVFDADGNPVRRDEHLSDVSLASLELGPYRHFMQKEIHEQPRAIADTIEALVGVGAFTADLFGRDADAVLRDIDSVQILACGTSYYAGLTARYWIEAMAGFRVRWRSPANTAIAPPWRTPGS
jgi:glucosamine--fructose-6-phosphate aminotransferase (isomerizing)